MKLTLNISPCPNDTFMFEALVNGRVDTRGLEFEVKFADIEELNREVMGASRVSEGAVSLGSGSAECGRRTGGRPDVSKISYAVLQEVAEEYEVLGSGSALGRGNGPVLVARPGGAFSCGGDWGRARVAVPGLHTTANMLLGRLFPGIEERVPVLFSEIAPAVARGKYDAGVLIHEGRFTYRDWGLEKVCDLGEEWAKETVGLAGADGLETAEEGLPLPLGAIVVRRNLGAEVKQKVEKVLRESIEYAMANPGASRGWVKEHAREMDDGVIDSHIALFVNENSLRLGPEAKRAVEELTGVRI